MVQSGYFQVFQNGGQGPGKGLFHRTLMPGFSDQCPPVCLSVLFFRQFLGRHPGLPVLINQDITQLDFGYFFSVGLTVVS